MRRDVVAAVGVTVAVAACIVAGVLVGKRVKTRKKWRSVIGVLTEFEEGCDTNVTILQQLVDAMAVEMHAGLASEGGSKLKMLVTYVDNLPNGSEEGTYYALDLGDANFRILRLHLEGERSTIIEHVEEQMPIPPHINTSTTQELFDFIASSLKQFLERGGNGSEILSVERKGLGFTFPFPVRQSSISSGVLIKWTKGWSIADMVGKDVVQCLQQALDKKGLDIRVAALVNDATGALALGYYYDEDTVASVIIGTGANACYLEWTDAIIKRQGLLTPSGGMVVNMEWGNFWSSRLPRTCYDVDLNANSPNPNDQGFEKMISGMYLGEIVRRVIHKMLQVSDLFGPISTKLATPFVLSTPLMAGMHEDISPELSEVAKVLEDILEMPNVPLKVRKLIVRLCDVVTRRAARLAAAGIVGILKKIGRDGSGGIASGISRSSSNMKRTVVAVEGWMYTSYTKFREYLNEALIEIMGEDIAKHVVLMVTHDGSGIGAALLAASN